MPIPQGVRDRLSHDPFMKFCVMAGRWECTGAVQWHHAWIYAGRQLQEWWSIVPLCWYHHQGGGLNREFAEYVSLMRLGKGIYAVAKKYPRFDWGARKRVLSSKFKNYHVPK